MNVEGIKTYLRDMAELETRVFTLRQTMGKFECCMVNEQRKAEGQLENEIEVLRQKGESCKKNIRELEFKIKESQEERRKVLNERMAEADKHTRASWVALAVAGCVAVIMFFLFGFWGIFLPVVLYFLFGAFYIVPIGREWKQKCQKDAEYWNGIVQEYQNKINQEIQMLQVLGAQINQLKNRRGESSRQDFYTQQIQAIERHLQALTETRAKLYAFDIVPEEYRALDCLLYLHQVFKIELADNMKDAVRIYEQKIFSGDVIKGIEHIYAKLDDLSGQMPFVTMVLENVTEKVKELCQELCDVVQTDPTSTTEETKLNRYATQALQESNERLAWYEEQRRLGLL